MRRPTLMLVAALLAFAAAAQTGLRWSLHLDCGTLDGTGNVLVVIDGHRSQPLAISCTRTPA